MYLIKQTKIFSKWLTKLKDMQGKVAILRRIDRMKLGNFGDHKSVGNNISELRITVGPGYRVYFSYRDNEVVVLLIGGDKSSQSDDIKKATQIIEELNQ